VPGSTNLTPVAQPDYVPIVPTDQVRSLSRLPVPRSWEQDRPAEIVSLRQPIGPKFGSTGSDLGYGLKLANLVGERSVVGPGEHRDDVVAGCFSCGSRRSSVFHRSPVIYDMEWAFALWGYWDFPEGPPEALVAWRKPIFAGAGHDYNRQRAIADFVRDTAIRLSPDAVVSGIRDWRQWFDVPAETS
jgi:hypothetical protein